MYNFNKHHLEIQRSRVKSYQKCTVIFNFQGFFEKNLFNISQKWGYKLHTLKCNFELLISNRAINQGVLSVSKLVGIKSRRMFLLESLSNSQTKSSLKKFLYMLLYVGYNLFRLELQYLQLDSPSR